MKLKNIFLLVGITLSLCFSSCSDDDGYKWGAVASGNQLNAVTFGADNVISTELDPADPTIINVKVYRDKADEAVEVPIKVITNDGSVFVVPEKVTFAAEQKEAFIDIAFDKAEIGTTYSLEIALDDDYVNPYLSSTTKTYAYEVTRVKWKSLGKSIWIDDFWYGEVFEVELYQRDDKPTSYRFENPYTDEYTGGNATYQKYIVLDTNNGYVSWDKYFFINTFVDDYGAELKGYYPSALDEEEAASDDLSKVVLTKDDAIHYLTVCPYWYMDEVGGYGTDYPCYLVFPGQELPDIEGVECWWLDDDEEEEGEEDASEVENGEE